MREIQLNTTTLITTERTSEEEEEQEYQVTSTISCTVSPETQSPSSKSSTFGYSSAEKDVREYLPIIAPRWFLCVAVFLMLGSATFDTTATKYMNRQKLPPCQNCSERFFEAPLFQTWTGYIGEFILLFIYAIDTRIAQFQNTARRLDFPSSPSDFKKLPCPIWVWIFPLLLDYASTACLNYATMLVQASTVQMLRSFNIILTCCLSAFALKNRLYVHQLVGVFLVLLGMILIGFYAILYPETQTNYGNLQWLGILTALLGTGLSSLQWVLEESIFRRYYCSPFEGVGWMGLYGVILGGALLYIAHAVGLENTVETFYQLGLNTHQSRLLILFAILYVISLSINTASGITVTKLSSSLLRTIVNAGRTVCIWGMEMILSWATFEFLNFIGLIVIICAMALYNYNYFTENKNNSVDKCLRKTATCLPNKYEVTHLVSSPKVITKPLDPPTPKTTSLTEIIETNLINVNSPGVCLLPRHRSKYFFTPGRLNSPQTPIEEEIVPCTVTASDMELGKDTGKKDDWQHWRAVTEIELGR